MRFSLTRLVRPRRGSLNKGPARTRKHKEGGKGRTFDLPQVIVADAQPLQIHQPVQATDLGNRIAEQIKLRERCMDDLSLDRLEEVVTKTERLNTPVIQYGLKSN